MLPPHSSLDDPDYAAFAWTRYKKLMRWMVLASSVTTLGCLMLLRYLVAEPLTIHMYIATAGGVFMSVLLAAALMGLVFLSAGSGHDDAIENPLDEGE
jgi:deoxyhypusine synthase